MRKTGRALPSRLVFYGEIRPEAMGGRISDVHYKMAEPPVIIQAAMAATVKAPVYTLPVRR